MVANRSMMPEETNPGLVSAAIQAITQYIRVEDSALATSCPAKPI